MLISLLLCIITSAPILQLCASNNSDEEMCQQVPSASVAMPPLFIELRVVFFDAMFAVWLLTAGQRCADASRPRRTSRHAINPRHSSQKYSKRFSAKSMYTAVLVGDPVRLSTPDLAILVCF
jgi:hypothetical protein